MSELFSFETPVIIDDKQILIDNMNKMKNMSVEENVFYRKYHEVKRYRDKKGSSVKAKIWTPTDINNKELTIQEIKNIKPVVEFVNPNNAPLMNDWLMLRIYGHTMEYDQNPGRFLRFLIKDGNAETDLFGFEQPKYLGAISVVSDVISLGPREEYIGWTEEDRLVRNRLRHSAIGSCIMPTQPFGYNFIGGKLIACLTAGSVVRATWEKLYKETLVGVTTTSLYGTGSMYDGMPKFWAGIGESSGKVSIKPDDSVYEYWHDKIKELYPDEYLEKMTQKNDVSGPVTGAKQRIMQMIFKSAGIKASDYQHGYKRGVYYALVYKNGKEFFQSKIEESALTPDMLKDQWKDDSTIIEWWREKAIRRYEKLHSENRLKPDILFYNDIADVDYETAKKMYFSDVGR